MGQYVVLGHELGDTVLPLDTEEQTAEAAIAIRDAGLGSLPVMVGSPDSPDSYASGRVLFAAAQRYQVGSYGAGGEWHPVAGYDLDLLTHSTREDAEAALEQIAVDSDDPDAVRSELSVREVSS